MSVVFFLALWTSLANAEEIVLKFSKTQISINKIVVDVEKATSLKEQQHGLMYRKKKLGENQGMLFIYEKEKPLTFWMKNTFIPLSIAFFSKEKILINIEDMDPVSSIIQKDVDIARSAKPSMYALEMNKGWFAQKKILPGHKFEFINGEKRP